jgi:hypothetical protein
MQWNNKLHINNESKAIKVDFGGSFNIVPEATEADEKTNANVTSPTHTVS